MEKLQNHHISHIGGPGIPPWSPEVEFTLKNSILVILYIYLKKNPQKHNFFQNFNNFFSFYLANNFLIKGTNGSNSSPIDLQVSN